jgi:hypothetical protein
MFEIRVIIETLGSQGSNNLNVNNLRKIASDEGASVVIVSAQVIAQMSSLTCSSSFHSSRSSQR